MSKEAINQCKINKFLANAIGEFYGELPPYPDYHTNEGYGKLRDFYDGWDEDKQLLFIGFIEDKDHKECDGIIMPYFMAYLHAFHRDNLASLMAEFLQRKVKSKGETINSPCNFPRVMV